MQIVLKPEEVTHPHGLAVTVAGFKGDVGHEVPSQVFIEIYEGRLRVHVWDGAEDPVSSVDIERLS
jgi:hypothetical protein